MGRTKDGTPMSTHVMEHFSRPHLDAATLEELVSLDAGEPGFFGEVMASYFAESQKRLNALDLAVARADVHSAASAAHCLRGSSANVGVIDVAESCAALEEAVRRGEELELGAAVERIRAAYHAAAPVLDGLVAEHRPAA
jgi:HPt (histidine-containing phosphotransfer) domain-containing protein